MLSNAREIKTVLVCVKTRLKSDVLGQLVPSNKPYMHLLHMKCEHIKEEECVKTSLLQI